MQFIKTGEVPKRKKKTVPTALDGQPEWERLKVTLLSGQIGPGKEVALVFGPDDAKALGIQFPWRVAADQLRKLLDARGWRKAYAIRKYEASDESSKKWVVSVRRTRSKSRHAAEEGANGRRKGVA